MPTRFNALFTFFSIQLVITKVEIIPFSMGFYLLFDPFVKERKRMGQSSSNREATIFFRVGQNLCGKFM